MVANHSFAVFDVRERGEYNDRQIPGTISLPRSQIEFRIHQLVPDFGVVVVVYDDADGRAPLAANTLTQLGYTQVSTLDGGLARWRSEGRPTVSGVNVPSKAFGEKVHHERNVPEITVEALHRLQEQGEEIRILDMRTPEEYGRFCIPGGVNIPGGELILWAEELKQSAVPVIVNCAGRTRSIIGTAGLRRLGLTNVRALKNGTMGWVLAGFELEKNPARMTPAVPPQSRAAATETALEIARKESIASISSAEISQILARNSSGIVYLIDVRSEREYESGHISGSISVPGGQAVQRADDFVAVRNAQIVFISDESARATMAAYWYRQMGFPNVFILQGGLRGWSEYGGALLPGAGGSEPLGLDTAKRTARLVEPHKLDRMLRDSDPVILDVGTSAAFESAHLPRAKWISRGWIEIEIPRRFPDRNPSLVITCSDGQQSVLAARTLSALGYTDVWVLRGGVQAWTAAGFPAEHGIDCCLMQPNDVVLSPSIRGSREDMQRYLDWELQLQR